MASVGLSSGFLVSLIYYGEYHERENRQKSFYKAGVTLMFCTGNIIGTGVATTAAIFLVVNIMAVRAKHLASNVAKKSNILNNKITKIFKKSNSAEDSSV